MIARLLTAALTLLLLLVACGPSGDGRTQVVAFVWKPENPAAWDDLLAEFHEAHPDIRVALEVGPNNSTQLHDLLTQKLRNRDRSVDAFLMDVIWTPEFAAAGWTRPVDGSLPPEERSAFFPGPLESVTWDGRVHAFPFLTDAGLLYYRKDLLEKHGLAPPRTWPELVERAEAILAAEADSRLHGFSAQLKQYEGLVCDLLEYVHANGGRLDDPDSPEAIQAITFVRDRIVDAVAPKGVLTYAEQESLDLFRSGGAVFLRNWPYAWAILERSPLAGKVGISVLPSFPGGGSASALGGWNFGVSAFTEHPEEALAFARFMTGPAAQKTLAVREGKAPTRRALYEDPEVLAANPHYADLKPVFEAATPRPMTPVYPRISHILQRALHAAISDRGSDVEALMKDAARRLRDVERELR
ncbi:MAG: ABC transporter substrate-binding protein [Planctomycetota bacterium]